MKYLKSYEGSGFGNSYPGHEEPTPKFKIGDEVMVISDLEKYENPYGIIKGDLVKITNCWIYANGAITYKIDSPKIRKLKKGYNTNDDYFGEFNFEYEWKVNSKKYNL